MQHHTRRLSDNAYAIITTAVAAILIPSWPAALHAQSPSTRRDDRRADMEERQRALHSLERIRSKSPRRRPDRRPSYQQVAEDFEQLQVRNYQLSVAAGPGPQLEYKRVREEAAEIKRLASRLRSALALPGEEKDQKQKRDDETLTPEGLRAAVVSLDALVKSFVWNPVFQKPDVVDLENSVKARRDLGEILRLSEQIRDAAEALVKGTRKSF